MALLALLLLISLSLSWCCTPKPGAINIARQGAATQSSNMNSDANLAKQAIDGVKDLNYYNGYCSHTLKEYSPWWKLDLKMKYKINYVEISGRSDCSFCFERLKCAEIRIGDNSDNNNPVCDVITNTSVATTSYCCYGMEGQFLSIVIPNHTEFLTLCEVEVYGDPVTL